MAENDFGSEAERTTRSGLKRSIVCDPNEDSKDSDGESTDGEVEKRRRKKALPAPTRDVKRQRTAALQQMQLNTRALQIQADADEQLDEDETMQQLEDAVLGDSTQGGSARHPAGGSARSSAQLAQLPAARSSHCFEAWLFQVLGDEKTC